MRIVILAHADDYGANLVGNLISRRSDSELLVLRPESLSTAQWSQRISKHGKVATHIHWRARGQSHYLSSDGTIAVLWNRLKFLPQPAFRNSKERDRTYASCELTALVESWLASEGDRVEPSVMRHASVSPLLHRFQWVKAASQCGITLARDQDQLHDFSVLRTPFGLHGASADRLSTAIKSACDQMARVLGFAVFSLQFCGSTQDPLLCGCDVQPDIRSEEEAQAVARWLLSTGRRHAPAMDEISIAGADR